MPGFRRFARPVLLGAVLLLATPFDVLAQDDAVGRARSALALSNYELAAKELSTIKGAKSLEAVYLSTRLQLWTGKYAEAATSAKKGARLGLEARVKLAPWHAEALARQGKLDEAIKVLRDVEGESDAHRARLLLGELLIDSGKRAEADGPLREIIKAYNADIITDSDAEGMSLVGRAAHLLRNYSSANQGFDLAERAGANKRVETLLWRAELFLEKYDPGHAAQVTSEAAKLAPADPRVLVMMAHVKLDQTMDFAEAERLVDKALKIDPNLAAAHFVRAGLALRVMDLEAADRATEAGLKTNPRDLDLLSMRAATRFLAEDKTGFDSLEQKVLSLNPSYSRFYSIVGEFAEWEHRYDDIVEMMRKAVAIDALDSKAYAQLGLNLIRSGDETTGLEELQKAWRRDKFNVRVFNTLNLYEDVIAKDYETVDGTRFRIRYHKDEHRILERYVPRMLNAAWTSMVKRYGFTPTTPISIELYADPEHFSVRTSGLPNVGIQGVCFGKTLAALSPAAGSFNWGMIVWHELAHVFHIQLSHNRVPRWFTEGLAEYETIIQRPEWQREEQLALYEGLRAGKIPKVDSFNRAFTHVDSSQDVVMAYFAASQISVFMAKEFGFDKVVRALELWGQGKPTSEVVQQSLGISSDELDRRFRKWLAPRLAGYDKQFVPDLTPPKSLEDARKAVADDPKSAPKLVKLAIALFGEGQEAEAAATLQLALRQDPKDPNALFIQLRLALAQKEIEQAESLVKKLIAAGHDGYAVRMKVADIAELKEDKDGMRAAFFAAHKHDPLQAEPLQALYDLARKDKDTQGQLWALRELAKLDQHDRRVYERLLAMLVKRGKWEEARKIGEAAIYVDVTNPTVHFLYARALARTGRHVSAIFELNSAIISRPKPDEAAQIYRMMAEGYKKLGRAEYAAKAEKYAEQAKAMRPPSDEPAPP